MCVCVCVCVCPIPFSLYFLLFDINGVVWNPQVLLSEICGYLFRLHVLCMLKPHVHRPGVTPHPFKSRKGLCYGSLFIV